MGQIRAGIPYALYHRELLIAPGRHQRFERRVESHARFALLQFYLMVPVAVAGVVRLWRSKVTVIPLVAPFVLVTFTAAGTFGITRYRVPSEVALCILAGLGAAWVTSRVTAPEAEIPADADPVPA